MPILHGDRVVGGSIPTSTGRRTSSGSTAVYAEPDAPASAWPAIRKQIDELAAWLGAEDVVLPDFRRSGARRPARALRRSGSRGRRRRSGAITGMATP